MEPRAKRCNAVMAELRENLLGLYKELTAGQISCVHKSAN
jgi:hypothetical protein